MLHTFQRQQQRDRAGEWENADTFEGFAGSAISGWLNISGNDLHHLAAEVAGGRVSGDGTFDLKNNRLRATLDVKASNVTCTVPGGGLRENEGECLEGPAAAGPVGRDRRKRPPFKGLQTELDAQGSDIRAGEYAMDSGGLRVSTKEGVVRIEKMTAQRAQNTLTASGTYEMPGDMKPWTTAPGSAQFAVHAPSLAAYNAEPNLKGPDGELEASGTIKNGPDGYRGGMTANLSALRMQDFRPTG